MKTHHLVKVALPVICIVLLGLTVYINQNPVNETDHWVSRSLQATDSATLVSLAKILSLPGKLIFSLTVVLITSLVLYLKKCKAEAFTILYSLGVYLLGLLMKVLVNRPRPSALLIRVTEINTDGSFPSGTVLFSTVFLGLITYLIAQKTKGLIRVSTILFTIGFVSVICWSRIYLGAHWFSDTLGGVLSGLILLILIIGRYIISQAKIQQHVL